MEHNGIQSLFKYADDSNIVAPVWKNYDSSADLVNDFLTWSENNQMSCNPSTCNELVIRKKITMIIMQRLEIFLNVIIYYY